MKQSSTVTFRHLLHHIRAAERHGLSHSMRGKTGHCVSQRLDVTPELLQDGLALFFICAPE